MLKLLVETCYERNSNRLESVYQPIIKTQPFIFNASPWPGRNLGMFWGWFGWMPAMGVAPLSAIYVIVYCLSGAGKRKPALRAFVRAAVHVMLVLALLLGLVCWVLLGGGH